MKDLPLLSKIRLNFAAILVTSTTLTPIIVIESASAAEVTILVQLEDYKGHEAYFSLYLTDENGRYVRTLSVSGKESKYHQDLNRWWRYLTRAEDNIDALVGASTKSGDRAVIKTEIADEQLANGYKIRVETAVEEQSHFPNDVEVALASDSIGIKTKGTGYVKYLRYKW